MSNLTDVYCQILTDIDAQGSYERNERTGRLLKVFPGGKSFRIGFSGKRLPVIGLRKLYPKTAAAELAWFIQGTRGVAWLQNHCGIWDAFVEDDGVTIDAAYGFRWRAHFGRDQLGMAIARLKEDPSCRRVMVSAWDPAEDGLGEPSKNVPCPTHFTLSIIGGELHSSLFLRSSDVFVGLPYDLMTHSLLLDAIAVELGVLKGSLHVTLAHAHIYDSHLNMMTQITRGRQRGSTVYLASPEVSVTQILEDPDGYVASVAQLAQRLEFPRWNPRPELVI